MPGIMRLFVRVEGNQAACLILADNLLPEHYLEIAEKHFKEQWRNTRQAPEIIPIRRIVFRNGDQLIDFRKKRKGIRPPPPPQTGDKGRRLYDEQHPENIRLDMVVTNPPVPSLLANCDTELMVKAITLNRLVMKITDPTCSPYLEQVFWTTYRTFSHPSEVLDKFIERYQVPAISRAGDPLRSPLDVSYYEEVQDRVRMRIVQLIERWVANHFFDFAEDLTYHKLLRFLRDKVDTDGVPPLALSLMRLNDRHALGQRKPVVPPGALNRGLTPTVVISSAEPRTIANQLTLLTLHTHNHIQPHELLGRQWEGAGAANVPNFIAYRDFINRVSNWVTYTIVSEKDPSMRAHNMGRLLQVCECLHNMHNWDALVAVYGGLSDPAVSRLTQTIAALPPQDQPLVSKFEELLSQRGSSKMLKAAMASSPRPHFPSIVVHLRDLLHLEETPVVVDGMINLLRCSHQHNLVSFLLDGQNASLDIVPNPDLMGVFSFWKIVDDRILSALSLECQQR